MKLLDTRRVYWCMVHTSIGIKQFPVCVRLSGGD